MQMRGKRSSGVSRFSDLLARLDSLAPFHFDPAQVEVERFYS